MAMPGGITINVFNPNVLGRIHKIIPEDGLHGMIRMAYIMGILYAIVARSVVRIEPVSIVVCPVSGFGRVRREIANTLLEFETVGP